MKARKQDKWLEEEVLRFCGNRGHFLHDLQGSSGLKKLMFYTPMGHQFKNINKMKCQTRPAGIVLKLSKYR